MTKRAHTHRTHAVNLRRRGYSDADRLLSLPGFQPEFFHCIVCGEEIQPVNNTLSLQEGRLLCQLRLGRWWRRTYRPERAESPAPPPAPLLARGAQPGGIDVEEGMQQGQRKGDHNFPDPAAAEPPERETYWWRFQARVAALEDSQQSEDSGGPISP